MVVHGVWKMNALATVLGSFHKPHMKQQEPELGQWGEEIRSCLFGLKCIVSVHVLQTWPTATAVQTHELKATSLSHWKISIGALRLQQAFYPVMATGTNTEVNICHTQQGLAAIHWVQSVVWVLLKYSTVYETKNLFNHPEEKRPCFLLFIFYFPIILQQLHSTLCKLI